MIEYIKRFVHILLEAGKDSISQVPSPPDRKLFQIDEGISQLSKELDRLDPRDFEPSVQTDVMRIRANVIYLCGVVKHIHHIGGRIDNAQFQDVLHPLLAILAHYRGEGTGGASRTFSYLHDVGLRAIVERDYAELRLKLFPSGAWKSTVVMAGSILEALLFDRLTAPGWRGTAEASPKCVDKKKGKKLSVEDLTLEGLIDVALDIRRLPEDPANTIHHVLRSYRNFIHPKKEIRANHDCGEPEAMQAVGALDSVCKFLENHP